VASTLGNDPPRSSPLSFSTVDDFLKRACEAKQGKRQAISAAIGPHLDEHGTVGVPPELAQTIEKMLERHGDETYRQIALFALGKWFELHMGMFTELAELDEPSMACSCLMDATRISDALHLLGDLRSIGGDESWRTMLSETLSLFILEELEEQ